MLFLPLLYAYSGSMLYICALLFVCFSSGNYVTHVVIVKDAVIGSPPHAILHRSLTNQIAITPRQSFLYLIR